MSTKSGESLTAEGPPQRSQLAYERIYELILSGALRPGAPILERRLAERLAISRTPIREALVRLEVEGLVSSTASRSMNVVDIGIADFSDILKLRRLLEAEGADAAARKGIKPSDIRAVGDAVRAFMETDGTAPGHEWHVDDLVHDLISRCAQNGVLGDLIRNLRRRSHVFMRKPTAERRLTSAKEHLGILDAVAIGDAETARERMCVHIDNVKRAAVESYLNVGRHNG